VLHLLGDFTRGLVASSFEGSDKKEVAADARNLTRELEQLKLVDEVLKERCARTSQSAGGRGHDRPSRLKQPVRNSRNCRQELRAQRNTRIDGFGVLQPKWN